MLWAFCTTPFSSALQDTGKQGLLWNLPWPCLLQSCQTWAMSPPMEDGAGPWCLEPPSPLGLHLPSPKLSQSTSKRSRLSSTSPTARLPGQRPSCVPPPTEEVSEARLCLPLEREDLSSAPKRENAFLWESSWTVLTLSLPFCFLMIHTGKTEKTSSAEFFIANIYEAINYYFIRNPAMRGWVEAWNYLSLGSYFSILSLLFCSYSCLSFWNKKSVTCTHDCREATETQTPSFADVQTWNMCTYILRQRWNTFFPKSVAKILPQITKGWCFRLSFWKNKYIHWLLQIKMFTGYLYFGCKSCCCGKVSAVLIMKSSNGCSLRDISRLSVCLFDLSSWLILLLMVSRDHLV